MTSLETELRETLTELAPDDVDTTGWATRARTRAVSARRRRIAAGATLAAVVLAGAAAVVALERGTPRASLPMRPDPDTTTFVDSRPDPSSWIAFQTLGEAADRVHVSRVDGSDDHVVAEDVQGRTGNPDFSRDGTSLAFDQLGLIEGVDQVYVSDAEGDGARVVARCRPPLCLGHGEPSWSPDGTRLAVSVGLGPRTGDEPSRFGLATVDLASQRVTPVLSHPVGVGVDHDARWSPDGSTLVFWRERTADDGSTKTAIFRVDLSGGDLRQLTPWDLVAGTPDWSPDGSSIVFATTPLSIFPMRGHSELYVMDADGTGMRQITDNGPNGPRAGMPRWTPDGRSIVYVRAHSVGNPRHVYSIMPDGSGDGAVLVTHDLTNVPVVRPGP